MSQRASVRSPDATGTRFRAAALDDDAAHSVPGTHQGRLDGLDWSAVRSQFATGDHIPAQRHSASPQEVDDADQFEAEPSQEVTPREPIFRGPLPALIEDDGSCQGRTNRQCEEVREDAESACSGQHEE